MVRGYELLVAAPRYLLIRIGVAVQPRRAQADSRLLAIRRIPAESGFAVCVSFADLTERVGPSGFRLGLASLRARGDGQPCNPDQSRRLHSPVDYHNSIVAGLRLGAPMPELFLRVAMSGTILGMHGQRNEHEGPCYAFIDLDNVRRPIEEAFRKVYGSECSRPRLTFSDWPGDPSRSYVYDCEYEEDDDDLDEERLRRKQEREDDFRRAESVAGVHVRVGRLVRAKRKKPDRQKGIDVDLAVQLVTFAFRKVIRTAVLVSGDADFVPAVQAAAETGTWIIVVSALSCTSDELVRAADAHVPLTLELMHKLVEEQPHFVEHRESSRGRRSFCHQVSELRGESGVACIERESPSSQSFQLRLACPDSRDLVIVHPDRAVLQRYAEQALDTEPEQWNNNGISWSPKNP